MIIRSVFKPAWWLKNPHLQTLWPQVTGYHAKIALREERFTLRDGDFLDLVWAGEGDGPIVIVLHGIGGSIKSPYATGALKAIAESGCRGVLMHFRGSSGKPNVHARTYDASDTNDLQEFVISLMQREPNTPLAGVGFSLGGNVLLKWLGETRQYNPLKAAVAVSVPFVIEKSLNRVRKGFSRFYHKVILDQLRDEVLGKFKAAGQSAPIDLDAFSKVKDLHDFNSLFVVPVHGYLCPEDYYQRASCRQYLRYIEVPTLIVHAEDDPFMSPDVIPTEEELSPFVTLELAECGGHVGFVSGSMPGKAEYWLEKHIPDFLRPILEEAYAQAQQQKVKALSE
ncbi:MAG: hydrolase [Gammaproteobacteria bacterium CG11_big_fil_rev_8_21_14_0_20_46_22]|nr:MAG: hydrolase [Gammaproteobacteria bacterium CG11_big_fil_rev_8_21_14_0_20_46_22]